MALESATYVTQLNTSNPTTTDPRSEGDAHLRLIKTVMSNELGVNTKEWVYTGDSLSWVSATQFTLNTDKSATYQKYRRIQVQGSSTGTIYGRITSSTYSSTTAIRVQWDSGSAVDEALTPFVSIASADNRALGLAEATKFQLSATSSVETNVHAALTRRAYHVAEWGARGDGTTDDKAALQAAAGRAGTFLFEPGATYKVWATGTISTLEIMMEWNGIDGIVIDGRGCTINVEDTFAGTEEVTLFKFTDCKNIVIRNFTFTGTKVASPDHQTRGYDAFDFYQGCENVVIENIHQTAGLVGVRVSRAATDPTSYISKRFRITNYYADRVGYPLSFQHAGDQVVVRNFEALEPGRVYFPYGVRNHDIQLTVTDGQTSPTCNLACFQVTSTANYLEQVRLDVTAKYVGTTAPNLVGLSLLFTSGSGSTICQMRDIDVHVNYDWNNTAAGHALFVVEKLINGGGYDTTTSRGYVVENVILSGTVTNQNSGGNIVDFANGDRGNWTGEIFRGIKVRDLVVTGTNNPSMKLGGAPFQDSLVMENVHFDGSTAPTVTTGNWAKGIRLKNTTLGGTYYGDGFYPDTGQGVFADTTYGVTHVDSSDSAAEMTLAGGSYTGQKKLFVCTAFSASASLVISNHSTSDPETITFSAVDDMIELIWTGTEWVTATIVGASA